MLPEVQRKIVTQQTCNNSTKFSLFLALILSLSRFVACHFTLASLCHTVAPVPPSKKSQIKMLHKFCGTADRQTDKSRASEQEGVKQKTWLSFCWANSRHVASTSTRGVSDINHGPSKCINCVLNVGVNGQRNYISVQSLTSYQLSSFPASLSAAPAPAPATPCSAFCTFPSLNSVLSLCCWQTTLSLYLPLWVQHATLKIVIESVVWHITYTQRVTASWQRARRRGLRTAAATVTATVTATMTMTTTTLQE